MRAEQASKQEARSTKAPENKKKRSCVANNCSAHVSFKYEVPHSIARDPERDISQDLMELLQLGLPPNVLHNAAVLPAGRDWDWA